MAYQEKYNYTFVSIDGKTNLVEIWQDTAETLTAEEVKCGSMPFTVELPEIDHKVQPVWGKGCNVELISDVSFKFFTGLYHVDKKEFIVKHYIDSAINFLGYLNSEMSRESYTDYSNYQVSVIGNDGFSLLERIQFLQDDGSLYTGVKSFFEILTICIDRIELPFSAINIALSTTSTLITIAADETLFHHQYIDCANFINEDGDAETMRKVLESILQPFGAVITQESGSLWVTDINSKAAGTGLTFKSFILDTTWDYDSDINFIQLKNISTVGYNGTGADIERSGGKNKQVVTYSPYPIKTWLSDSLMEISEFDFIDFAWSTRYKLNYKKLLTNKYWTATEFELVRYWFDPIVNVANYAALPAATAASKSITYITTDNGYNYRWNGVVYVFTDSSLVFGSDQSIHFVVRTHTTNTKIASSKVNPFVTLPKSEYSAGQIVQGAMIVIKGRVQLLKWINYSLISKQGILSHILITLKIKIGSYYYNGVTWTTTDSFYYPRISKKNDEMMGTPWNISSYPNYFEPEFITLGNNGEDGIYIPIDQDISGAMEIEIWSDFFQDGGVTNYQMWHDPRINEAWYSNLSINVVQSDTSEIPDSAKEYIGYLNPLFKEEAKKTDLICGTMTSITDRGKILYFDTVYKALKSWTRAGQTFEIEKLLLNTLSSNYKEGYIMLNGLKLNNSFNSLNVFQDTFTDASIMAIKSLKVNYRDNIAECNLHEISPDILTIV